MNNDNESTTTRNATNANEVFRTTTTAKQPTSRFISESSDEVSLSVTVSLCFGIFKEILTSAMLYVLSSS